MMKQEVGLRGKHRKVHSERSDHSKRSQQLQPRKYKCQVTKPSYIYN
jgi:hypothetical protein